MSKLCLCMTKSTATKFLLCLSTQGEDQELVDVFSYLDLVEDCLDRAESSQTACLEGILKADITLTHSRGDADIGFIVLVKRAELLYIAVGFKTILCTVVGYVYSRALILSSRSCNAC